MQNEVFTYQCVSIDTQNANKLNGVALFPGFRICIQWYQITSNRFSQKNKIVIKIKEIGHESGKWKYIDYKNSYQTQLEIWFNNMRWDKVSLYNEQNQLGVVHRFWKKITTNYYISKKKDDLHVILCGSKLIYRQMKQNIKNSPI